MAIFALVLTSCTSTSDGDSVSEETSVRLADTYSTTHPFARHGVSYFIESLESEGIGVDYFPAGQMGNDKDLAVLAETSVMDIVPASAAYLEDDMPLSSVSDLPNTISDTCIAANAMMDLLSEGGLLYEEEYEPRGLRPLWVTVVPTYELFTASQRIETPADVRGLIIRSSGGAFDLTTDAINAAPVNIPAGDTYEAMTRNTVDGAAFPHISAIAYGLEDVSAYVTEGLNLGSVTIPYVISEEAWQGLSQDEQQIITESAAETNQNLCEGINEETVTSKEEMGEAGVTYVPIEGSDADEWEDLLSDVRNTWASNLDGIGLRGSDVLDAYDQAVLNYESE